MSKPRWEAKYEKYKAEEPISAKIEELKVRLNGKTEGNFKTKEEFEKADSERRKNIQKELEGYENYEKNKDKIRNIYEYRKLLEEKIKELPIDTSKQVEQGKEYIKERKKELTISGIECTNLMNEINKLHSELKKANDVEKASITAKINEKKELLGKAQDKQTELMEKIPAAQELLEKLQNEGKKFDDNANNKKSMYERRIAKCNMIAANLLKGKELEDIELKGVSGQYTSKNGNLKQKINNAKTTVKTNDPAKTGANLPNVSEFEQKHPRLAKVVNFLKNVKDRVVKFFKGDEENQGQNGNTLTDDEDKALQEIANKGHKEYVKGLREAAKQKAANEYAERYPDAKGNKYHHQDGANVPIPEKEDDEPTK